MDHREKTKIIFGDFVKRAEAMNFKGAVRDKASLEFVIGAICCADALGDKSLHDYLEKVVVFTVSLRGFQGLKEIAEGR